KAYQGTTIVTGWNVNQPQIEDYERVQIKDDISYLVQDMGGSHVFKAGVNFEREPLSSKAEFFSGGSFTYRADTSSAPFQGQIGVGDAQTSSMNYKYGVYVQDDWTVLPNLTLNLGLRWDVETNMIGNDYVLPQSLASDTALTNHVPASYIGNGKRDIDYGQIAPRIGFAWDVFKDKMTVVHGGFGMFYDRIIYNVVSNEQQNGRYNIYTVRFSSSFPATTNRDVLRGYVTNPPSGANSPTPPAPAVTLIPSSVPTPYTQQWTIGVSQQLTPELAASLDYVGIRGFNEYTTYNVNYTNGIGGPRVATPKYAGITLLTSDGQSWYDGLQFSLTRPYLGDWQMQLSYTLSWAYNTFDDPFQGYAFRSSITKAPSQQDERHRFVLSGIVNLPYNFQLSGIITLSSPRPLSLITGTDDNKDGALGDDFPADGRNSFRPDPKKINFWTKNVDIRLTKFFEFSGLGKIGIMAEAFNLFNWTNYTNYFSTLNQKDGAGNLLFNTPNGAAANRQIQFGMRVFF
ncbi:MAG: TonB-dependent receptor, partial [Ignavibacteriales bacterium]|nr:TonB-dependent receptor [Ignavibacteriales bacterium]